MTALLAWPMSRPRGVSSAIRCGVMTTPSRSGVCRVWWWSPQHDHVKPELDAVTATSRGCRLASRTDRV